jgi:four helix bundle protein
LRAENLELRRYKLRSKMTFNFQKLNVYQKSLDISVELVNIAVRFPSAHRRIADQLIGAVTSISLNIAEGSGRSTQKDRNQFYRIAKTSAYEVIAILDICEKIKLIDNTGFSERIEEICKMLSGLIKN